MTGNDHSPDQQTGLRLPRQRTRRQFISGLGAAAGAGLVIGACGDDSASSGGATTTTAGTAAPTTTTAAAPSAPAAGRAVKVGFVSPKTGPLAGFAEADEFVLSGIRARLSDGLDIGGVVHPIEIIEADSASDPNAAADAASELILGDGVDLIAVGSTPETTNPVSDQCEANGTPCITTMVPWEAWFFGRGGDPATGFDWTYHFFWGIGRINEVFLGMWELDQTNRVVAGLWPNDGDGTAWGDPELGIPAAIAAAGYELVDPGRYPNLSDDFSSQIGAYRDAGCEILVGNPIPPDFATFWAQAAQQGFNPKIATIAKAALFPSAVEALGDRGEGIAVEVWWSPSHPFSSSLTGQSSAELAESYIAATGRQWTQPIGFVHSVLEVAVDVLSRTADVDDSNAVIDAVKTTRLDTITGPVSWGAGPIPNVTETPLVGGQWLRGDDFPYELAIVTNEGAPEIATTAAYQSLA